ncbi:hypothetical protein ENSA7_09180 [Enhygromyxa salina]|uniref:Uncharacterized protein n=1 Tax=Enhygromyxa salina TaxID=215803 RepID=A0A2S9YW81_9BACT|nr:hypothetical protein ENSA7_09180 [Enhygromyxa salina]
MCYSVRLLSHHELVLEDGSATVPVVLFVYPDVREHPKGDRP